MQTNQPARRRKGPAARAAVAAPVRHETTIRGTLLGIRRGAVYGSVLNTAAPDQRLAVRLLIDGAFAGEMIAGPAAGAGRDDAANDTGHRFAFPLRAAWFDGRPHTIQVEVDGMGVRFPDTPTPVTFEDRMRIGGEIKGLHASQLVGWVWDCCAPDAPLAVEVLVDGRPAAAATADLFSEALLKAGLGNGAHGFAVPMIGVLTPGREHKVQLMVKDLSVLVPAEPVALSLPDHEPVIEGHLDGLFGGMICGWIRDAVRPDAPLLAELLVDGRVAAAMPADIYRDDLKTAELGSGRHGFAFTVDAALRDGRPHQVQVRAAGSTACIPAEPRTLTFDRRTPEVEGNLDGVRRGRILGWAWDRNRPDEVLALRVFIDRHLVGVIEAVDFRSDLQAAGKRGGYCSFEMPVPQHFLDDHEHVVEVFTVEHDAPLKRSPLKTNLKDKEAAAAAARTLPAYGTVLSRSAETGLGRAGLDGLDDHLVHCGDHDRFRRALAACPPVTLVIPVYNAYEAVRRCLASVVRNTSGEARLVIVDDASPDPRIAPLLQWYAELPNVAVITNERNQGYTRSINVGIRAAAGDVVLLNSDTEVTPRWLERLMRTAYRRDTIGTVTPLSDNAGAFSAPVGNQANAYPSWLTPEELGRLFADRSVRARPAVCTGSGFCMYIRRGLLDAIGLFDEDNFPRGYGEENDFCMRALKAGWENVIDDATIIFHERSASFHVEKTRLLNKGRAVLRRLHPEYPLLVRDFDAAPGLQATRDRVAALIEELNDPRPRAPDARRRLHGLGLPRVLYVIHGEAKGGTWHTSQDLMEGVQDDFASFLLTCDYRTMTLLRHEDGRLTEMNAWQLASPVSFLDEARPDYDAVLTAILTGCDIDVVHVRHLYKHVLSVPRVARALGIPVVLSFHDFFYVCPTTNLVDDQGRYCGGTCTAGDGECHQSLKFDRLPPLKHRYIHRWRERAAALFRDVDAFVTTAGSGRDVYADTFPELAGPGLAGRPFHVFEHGRDFGAQRNLAVPPARSGKPVRILCPGHITRHKGGDFIRALKALDVDGCLEFHFLGNLPMPYRDLGVWHGLYERDEFASRVAEIGASFAGIFSIWPETYCHTLSEAWACGLPVLGSTLGAVGDRIRAHGGGWTVDPVDPEGAYALIRRLIDDPAAYEAERVRVSVTNLRSVAEMGFDYAHLYKTLLAAQRPFAAPEDAVVLRIGVLPRRGANGVPNAIVQARWLRPLSHPHVRAFTQSVVLEEAEVLTGRRPAGLDVVVVDGEDWPEEVWRALAQARAASGVRVLVDTARAAALSLAGPRRHGLPDAVVVPAGAAVPETSGTAVARIVYDPPLDERPWLWAAERRQARPAKAAGVDRAVNAVVVQGEAAPPVSVLRDLVTILNEEQFVPARLTVVAPRPALVPLPETTCLVPPVPATDVDGLAAWAATRAHEWDVVLYLPSSAPRPIIPVDAMSLLDVPAIVADGDDPDACCTAIVEAVRDEDLGRQQRQEVLNNRVLRARAGDLRAVLRDIRTLQQPAAAPAAAAVTGVVEAAV